MAVVADADEVFPHTLSISIALLQITAERFSEAKALLIASLGRCATGGASSRRWRTWDWRCARRAKEVTPTRPLCWPWPMDS